MRIRLVLASLVLSLSLGSACAKRPVETVETKEAVAVSVQPARVDDLRSIIAATGTVSASPAGEWTVTAPQQGTIAELPKNEGDEVKEGDLLVRFDIPAFASDLAARRSDVSAANERMATSKAALDRISGLVEKGLVPRKDMEEPQRGLAEAEQTAKRATIAADAALAAADRANVRARFAGVVDKRWHKVGDQVDSTTDPVLRIVDPSRAEVVVSVPIAELGRVWVGRPATVSNPTSPTPEPAVVSSRPVTVDASSPAVEVRVKFTAPTTMPIGTAVNVEIIADERTSVLVIPASAVVRDSDGTFVMVVAGDNKAHKHPVKLGLTTRESVEIADGLKPGDLVIFRGQDGLSDGAPITIAK